MPERRAQLKSFVTRSRCCKDLVGVIYAVGGQTKSGNSLSTVEVYDPIAGRWKDAEARGSAGACATVRAYQRLLHPEWSRLHELVGKRLRDSFRVPAMLDLGWRGGVHTLHI